MQYWDTIVKTAMLGTARESSSIHTGITDLDVLIAEIQKQELNPEDRFLKITGILSHYQKAGSLFSPLSLAPIGLAEPEDKPYCPKEAIAILEELKQSTFVDLLVTWINLCVKIKMIAPPALLPFLLDLGKTTILLRDSIVQIGGKRAQWLSQFNEDWNYVNKSRKEIWETGKPEERKMLLTQVRSANLLEGLSLVEQSWKEESPAFKIEALTIIEKTVSKADEEFLKKLGKDNSPKVRQKAIELLRLIPESEYNDHLFSIVGPWISIDKTNNSTALKLSIPTEYNEELKKEGISKESLHKGYSDQEHRLFQALTIIPLMLWERSFSIGPKKLLGFFIHQKELQKFIPSLVYATIRQKNEQWALAFAETIVQQESKVNFLQKEEDLYQLISLLSDEKKNWVYENKLYKKEFSFPIHIIDFFHAIGYQWDEKLSLKILEDLVKNHLQELISNYFFKDKIYRLHHFFHKSIYQMRYGFLPEEELLRERWYKVTDKLFEALKISLEIEQAFQAS